VLDGQGAAGPPDALPVTLRAISPTGRPAPSSPTAWTRTAVGEVDHDPPPSRPPGPPDWPGACCLGVDAPPRPPVPLCVLAPADPAGLGRAGRIPVGVAVVCPTGLPMAAVADPAAGQPLAGPASGRDAGRPAAARSTACWTRRSRRSWSRPGSGARSTAPTASSPTAAPRLAGCGCRRPASGGCWSPMTWCCPSPRVGGPVQRTPWPDWLEYRPNQVWGWDVTHFGRCRAAPVRVGDHRPGQPQVAGHPW
jgi:hypothetical protein